MSIPSRGPTAITDASVLEMDLKEDVAAELEDFIFLARLGVVNEAVDIVDHVLWRHAHLFAVIAETSGFLVEHNDYSRLGHLLNIFKQKAPASEDRQEGKFIAMLNWLFDAANKKSFSNSIHKNLEKFIDLTTTKPESEIELHIIEVLSSAIVQHAEVDDGEFLRFWYGHFFNLLQRQYLWEATRMFAILCARIRSEGVGYESALIWYIYQHLSRKVGNIHMKLIEESRSDLRGEMLCAMVVRAEVLRTSETAPDLAVYMGYTTLREMHVELKRILRVLFDKCSDQTVRGVYAEICQKYGTKSSPAQDSALLKHVKRHSTQSKKGQDDALTTTRSGRHDAFSSPNDTSSGPALELPKIVVNGIEICL